MCFGVELHKHAINLAALTSAAAYVAQGRWWFGIDFHSSISRKTPARMPYDVWRCTGRTPRCPDASSGIANPLRFAFIVTLLTKAVELIGSRLLVRKWRFFASRRFVWFELVWEALLFHKMCFKIVVPAVVILHNFYFIQLEVWVLYSMHL